MRTACRSLVLIAATIGLAASERRPLPAFSVVSASGATVSSAALSSQPRWLLIYVSPDCRSCDRLLDAIEQWRTPQITSRLVVIVSGPVPQGAEYVSRHQSAGLDGTSWFIDAQSDAARRLELKGTPVLVGVERGEIDWMLNGVLNDPAAVEPVVRRWLQ